MVFQSYALYPHMKVSDNMGFGPEDARRNARAGSTSAVKTASASSICSPISTASRANCPAASASASPWAAPSCASRRCSCSTSRLSNLDAKLRVQMRAEIKALHQRLKIDIVYVTHDQIEAMTMADRIVVMDRRHDPAGRRAARSL